MLFPLYLLGGLLLAVPIYLHLKRRPPKEAVEFGSLMFLKPTRSVRVKRKSQVENVFLLLLRCLAVLLLVGMFARPFMKGGEGEEGGLGQRRLVLVDVSASMGRDGVWEEAVETAEEAVGDAGEALGVWAFDHGVRQVVGFDEWQGWAPAVRGSNAEAALKTLEAGGGATGLGAALSEAADVLGASGGGEIILVSDLQSGQGLEVLQTAAWPSDVVVKLEGVGEGGGAGVAAQWIGAAPDGTPRVRVVNSAEAEDTEIELQWEGADEVARVTVAPGQSRVFAAPGRGGKTGAGELKVGGTVLHYAAPVKTEVKVWVSGGKVEERATGDPVFFLARALKGDPRRSFLFVDDVAEAGLVVLTEGVEDATPIVERVAEKGATVLAVANAKTRSVLEALLGQGLEIEEAEVSDYSLLEGMNFEHPLMGAFKDPTLRDFSKIRAWKHRSVTLAEGVEHSVVARFDNGDPAWLDVREGEGRVFVFASGWQPSESQLALSSKFVPLLFSVMEGTGVLSGETGAKFVVGEEGLLADLGATETVVITRPDGEQDGLSRGEAYLFERAGLYGIEREDGSTFDVAANLPVSEGVLAPVGRDALVEMGVLLDDGKAPERADEKNEEERAVELAMETEERQKLWRWIVVGLFVVLMIETFLAGRRVIGSEDGEDEGAVEGAV